MRHVTLNNLGRFIIHIYNILQYIYSININTRHIVKIQSERSLSRFRRRPWYDLHFNLLQWVLATCPWFPRHSVVAFSFDASTPIILPIEVRLVALVVPPCAGESPRTAPSELLFDEVIVDVHRGESTAVVFGQRVASRTVLVTGHEDPIAVRFVGYSESLVVDDMSVAVPVGQLNAQAVVILVC